MLESKVLETECLNGLRSLSREYEGSCSLIYIDPPFMTQKTQKIHGKSYEDKFDNIESYSNFLKERIGESLKYLKTDGSIFIHLDYHAVHYIKCMMDKMLGQKHFINEIIWSYDYGGRAKNHWSRKHDNILWYVLDPKKYTFNYDCIDRIPYMAPKLVGPEKAERGKTPTTVWWNTIVPTNSKERVNYPTQKPLKILERIIKVHTNPGDFVLDFFAGSGTSVVAAAKLGRNYIAMDENPDAIKIINQRLAGLLLK